MIPAPLQIVIIVRIEMQAGRALPLAIRRACDKVSGPFASAMANWLVRSEAGRSTTEALDALPELRKTSSRKALLLLFDRGLHGAAIAEQLAAIEQEFYFSAETEYERQLQMLPLKLLAPLTLFILPSILILIGGPLVHNLIGGLQP